MSKSKVSLIRYPAARNPRLRKFIEINLIVTLSAKQIIIIFPIIRYVLFIVMAFLVNFLKYRTLLMAQVSSRLDFGAHTARLHYNADY